jgi:hypothetical protein
MEKNGKKFLVAILVTLGDAVKKARSALTFSPPANRFKTNINCFYYLTIENMGIMGSLGI